MPHRCLDTRTRPLPSAPMVGRCGASALSKMEWRLGCTNVDMHRQADG